MLRSPQAAHVTLLRLEGFAPSVEWSAQYLTEAGREVLARAPLLIESEDSTQLWQEI